MLCEAPARSDQPPNCRATFAASLLTVQQHQAHDAVNLALAGIPETGSPHSAMLVLGGQSLFNMLDYPVDLVSGHMIPLRSGVF